MAIPAQATQSAAWIGRLFAWAGIAIGFLALLGYDTPLASSQFNGVWLLFMGFFLENAARQSLVQNRIREVLSRIKVKDVMVEDPPSLDPRVTVGMLARGAFQMNPRACYFIEDEGKLAGLISLFQVAVVPKAEWDTMTAGEAMVPRALLTGTSADRSLADVLQEMEQTNVSHLPVIAEGRVIGVIGRDRIIARLQDAGLVRLPA